MFQAGKLTIEIRAKERVAVLDLQGAIRLGEESTLLRHHLREQIDAHRSVVLNFSGVTCLDSTGIGLLAEGKVHALHAGVQFRLCSLPPLVQKIARTLCLDQIMEIHETEAGAVAGL